ncbi:hypothetical protein SDC9_08476 [bioreactor metagenome]|uniref:Uncharacterized protein n=1 Tax=bioreactor metagenome TaxID=1076179 RepID=A0A644T7F2_9ZZZZ|nr:hypothetical protein [Methanobrevibacter sp.]MEA4957221.1 hypothetical protein [Methanobrevibacter sp.]
MVSKKEFNIPIYLDIDLLLDLMASIDDGFTNVEKITTHDKQSENSEVSKGGNVGFSLGSFFKFGFDASKNDLKGKNSGINSEMEKYHTYGSMMNKLINKLQKMELIKHLNDDTTWNNIEESDFIQIQGKFIPNSISKSFKQVNNSLDLIISISSINLGDGNYDPNQVDELKSLNKMVEKIYEGLEKGDSQKYIVEIKNSKYKAFVNLFNEFIRDNAGIELPSGVFKLFGKVIKKVDENEELDLLEETAIGGLSDEFIEILTTALKEMDSTIKMPDIETSTKGPGVQIVPIAIFV